MSDLHYYQYAFARPDCAAESIGAGVDPRFPIELVRDGSIAAVISRVGLDEFAPARLEGGKAEDLSWLAEAAARHDEIIRQAARTSPVLPLRLGTLFCSLDSLRAAMGCRLASVVEFFSQLGDRQEWGVKLYRTAAWAKRQAVPAAAATATANRPGAEYLAQKRAALEANREAQTDLQRTIEYVEQRLGGQAAPFCRLRTLPRNLTGRKEEMVFNAALLLSPSALGHWLRAAAEVREQTGGEGLLLEWSGPWPAYHFCPSLS